MSVQYVQCGRGHGNVGTARSMWWQPLEYVISGVPLCQYHGTDIVVSLRLNKSTLQ